MTLAKSRSRRPAQSAALHIRSSDNRSSSPMATRVVTKCIFCGSGNLTGEHVFSRWTHKYMGPRGKVKAKSHRGKQHLNDLETKITKLPGQLRDWQVWCVCGGDHKSCNGGWMRDIENAAKPIMVPLILGHESRLFANHQKIIATWAVLKAMIAEYDPRSETKVSVHHAHRTYLMKHLAAPKGWAVWIGSFERREWPPEWVGRHLLLLSENAFAKSGGREVTHFNVSSTTQVVGKLFIIVIHAPLEGGIDRWRFSPPEGGTLFRIWPPTITSIKWPDCPLSDQDADYAAQALARLVHTKAMERAGLGSAKLQRVRPRPS
jgi:hypothetical protein